MQTRDSWTVVGLATLFALAYAAISLFRHWQFGTNYDLAIFDQAIWHASRFEEPSSTVSGFSNILGDHFYPIVLTLAPLYWIVPRAETLLVAQAVLLAASIVPVHAWLRLRLPAHHSLALSVAYGLFWGLQRTALSDFHELAFAPILIGLAFLAIEKERWRLLWIVSGLLCLVKEDVILVVVGLGAYLLIRGDRRQGIALIGGATAIFAAVVLLLIPSQNDAGGWGYGQTYAPLLMRPWRVPLALITPLAKVQTILLWLAPFAFLPLFSPVSLALVPIALVRLLSDNPNHWGYGGHYTAPLAPILAIAAGDALSRVQRRLRGSARYLASGMLAFSVCASLVLPGHQPILRLFRLPTFAPIPTSVTARQALDLIPPDAPVTAQGAIAPHLAHRQQVFLLEQPRDAAFVIASTAVTPWPIASVTELQALLQVYRARGYVTVFEREGWVVLKRAP